MRATILPKAMNDTNQGPYGHGQYNGQGAYCGLSTVPKVFLIFTTQLYQYSSFYFYLHCT